MTTLRCAFCDFDRSATATSESAVQASREVAVHMVLVHPDWLDELLQHATDEWVARRQSAAAVRPDTDDALALLDSLRARFDQGHMLSWQELSDVATTRTPAAAVRETGLTEAWAAAEAALPEGWCLHLFDYGAYGPFNPPPGEPLGQPHVEATAEPRPDWVATAKLGILSSPPKVYGRGETPAEALRALAARLAEQP